MNNFIFRLRQKFTQFLNEEEKNASSNLTRASRFYFKIIYTTIESFINQGGFEKGATLTFYTLLSIVPLFAIGFGIAQYLGFENQFANLIKEDLYHQPEIAEKVIQFSLLTLKQARGDIIASVGIVVLLWTVVRMLGNIESYFNEFWHIKRSRSFWQQLIGFIPLILLFPLFLVGSSSLVIFLSTKSSLILSAWGFSGVADTLLIYLFKCIHFLLIWGWLTFLFIYLPFTKVSWKVGLKAGFIVGILFSLWQWLYVTFQINATSYGAIYGSFAAIPLFLFWLNYSWLILLFGSALSYQIDLKEKGIEAKMQNEE